MAAQDLLGHEYVLEHVGTPVSTGVSGCPHHDVARLVLGADALPVAVRLDGLAATGAAGVGLRLLRVAAGGGTSLEPTETPPHALRTVAEMMTAIPPRAIDICTRWSVRPWPGRGRAQGSRTMRASISRATEGRVHSRRWKHRYQGCGGSARGPSAGPTPSRRLLRCWPGERFGPDRGSPCPPCRPARPARGALRRHRSAGPDQRGGGRAPGLASGRALRRRARALGRPGRSDRTGDQAAVLGRWFSHSSGTSNEVSAVVARLVGPGDAYRSYLERRLFGPSA